MENRSPRELPNTGGFSLPHMDLYQHVLRLRQELAIAQGEREQEVTESPDRFPAANWKVKCYASAVTIFSAMTVEAMLNAYGLLRFGEAEFERVYARLGPRRKLRELVADGCNVNLVDEDPLVQALLALVHRRNELVHPRAYETIIDEKGFHVPDAVWNRPDTVESAEQSRIEMDTVVSVFPTLDQETEGLLRVRPIPGAAS